MRPAPRITVARQIEIEGGWGVRIRRLRGVVIGLAAAACVAVPATVLAFGGPAPGQATLDKKLRVGVDNEGRPWFLGGFSALFPLDSSGRSFVAVTDRGPNDDITCNGVAGKVIFVPAFTPRLIYFSVKNGKIVIDRVKPMRVGNELASGIANLPTDENSFSSSCKPLPNDPFGVDTEGISLDPRANLRSHDRHKGVFWVSDEYRPSILFMTARGELLARIVPKGATGDAYSAAVTQASADSGDSLDVIEGFPAIVGDRFRKNRGFEDVATQRFPGRTYVYTSLQSPMENPNTTTRNSLAIRVFRLDVTNVAHPVVDREWAALLDIKPGKKSPLSDKVSALWPAGPDKLLVEERDDTISSDPSASTKIYNLDFTHATNLLGGRYDEAATSPTLEQQYIPTTDGVVPPNPAGVTPGQKTLCIDVNAALTAIGLVNTKLEGVSVIGSGSHATLAAVNDNDFDLAHITNPTVNPASNPTTIDFVPLPAGCS
jgi:hypothetical protein